MKEINFNKIEKKWQDKWEKAKCFEVKEKSKKKKYYVLEQFPYPSGSGLHAGHAFVYTIGDVFARFKVMKGFNVLHPIGYDSLGLPAENAANKTGVNPKKYTEDAIKYFSKQQKSLGLSYDWSRMFATHNPDFYRWDQWIFLKMFEKGLAYKKQSPVNWCSNCKTVLANEQVHDGKCEYHPNTNVEIKHLNQWYLKITDYAEELANFETVKEWPDLIKKLQKNWIGKSHGTEIEFEIEDKNISNVVIVHGSPSKKQKEMDGKTRTYDKHWILWMKKQLEENKIKCDTPLMPEPWEPKYYEWKQEFEKIKINENSVLVGHSAGTTFLVRWLSETKKKIKKLILVAPWKISWINSKENKDFCDYKIDKSVKENVGEIMIFTADDEGEDGKKSVKIFEKEIGAKVIELKNHGHFTQGDMGTNEFPELLNEVLYEKWPIFTTRPDTIYGVTFMVVSAQHSKLFELVTDDRKKDVEKFVKKLSSVSEEEIDKLEKEGVFTGSYAINPINNEKVPVYAGNFVVADYGSGMVMAVPAHDQRDYDFAKKYGIKIKQVIEDETKVLTITESLKSQFYKEVEKFAKIVNKNGLSYIYTEDVDKIFELAKNNFIGNLWYIHSEGKIKKIMFHTAKENRIFNWNNNKGIEEAKTYGRKVGIKEEQLDFNEIRESYIDKGILINSDKFNGLENGQAKIKITEFLEKERKGKSVVNFRLRDWLVSRQRYWGTPIPIIYCDECGVVPVNEKDLPVKLPEKVQFGKGNPLETNEKWIKAKCPQCGKIGRRETDTMDTFVNSSWYYLRYCDSKNNKQIFDKEKANYWCPIDMYIGGKEHACMHDIYMRFYYKFLRDLGLVNDNEPARKLFMQGIVHAEDGNKMSKSLGNVVDPMDIIKKNGADSLRMFLVSVANPESDFNWSEKGVKSIEKFISKIWYYFQNVKFGKSSASIESKLNKSIKLITEDIENIKYNLAVIKLRQLFEYFEDKEISKKDFEKFLKMFSVFCPHICEELWEKIGNKGFISLEKWPEVDEKKIDEKLERAEQVEGNTVLDILNILKIIEDRGEKGENVYVYAMPFEINYFDEDKMSERVGKKVKVFSVQDKDKYDPKEISKKSKPGKPGIYVE